MVNPELINYIKSVREKGFSDDTIKQNLINHGYFKEIIDEAFDSPELSTQSDISASHVSAPGNNQTPAPKATPTKPKISIPQKILNLPLKKIFIIIALIVLVSAGTYGISLLIEKMQLEVFCDGLSMEIQKLQDNEVLCAFPDNSRLQAFLTNKGDITINFVEIRIKGTKRNFQNNVENVNLEKDNIFTLVVPYGERYGNIKEISLIPGIVEDGKNKLCTSKKLIRTNVKSC
ncbi:MAG: hypothetical protein ABIJ34_05100 [archaeon]